MKVLVVAALLLLSGLFAPGSHARSDAACTQKYGDQGAATAVQDLMKAKQSEHTGDHGSASFLYNKLAHQGVVHAQLRLAQNYARSIGVPRDLDRAYIWGKIALRCAEGRERDIADKLVADLGFVFPKKRLERANAIVEDWFRKFISRK